MSLVLDIRDSLLILYIHLTYRILWNPCNTVIDLRACMPSLYGRFSTLILPHKKGIELCMSSIANAVLQGIVSNNNPSGSLCRWDPVYNLP